MKIRPLFKWFGSKWSGSRHYPKPIGNMIIEPYAGSAGYSLNHCDRQVKVFDLDDNITRLWSWLIYSATPRDILEIPLIADSEIGKDIRSYGLSDGQALLLKHWQRTNNVGECWTISPWGNKPGQWTANTRERVAKEVVHVKHWEVIDDPVKYIDTIKATWFIDPPYQFNYKYSKHNPVLNYGYFDSFVQTIHPLIISYLLRSGRS